jgi:hypothetical protein
MPADVKKRLCLGKNDWADITEVEFGQLQTALSLHSGQNVDLTRYNPSSVYVPEAQSGLFPRIMEKIPELGYKELL